MLIYVFKHKYDLNSKACHMIHISNSLPYVSFPVLQKYSKKSSHFFILI